MGNRFRMGAIIVAAMNCGMFAATAAAQSLTLQFEAAQAIPNFDIDGAPARIHTQGLFVTKQYYYVTGRLETEPRRALFLRFDRRHPATVEFVDITPRQNASGDDVRLDHPGGFDFDGRDFWIPISASRPNSRTVVLRFPEQPGKPLSAAAGTSAFEFDDHIGAVAYDRTAKQLYGANWDTQIVYCWKRDGMLVEKIPREKLVRNDHRWALAVQDWKGLTGGRVFAGGIDKSPQRDPQASAAMVAILNVQQRSQIAASRVPRPPGTQHTITREGLAVLDDRLYLLPDDLGQDAHIFRYRWKIAPK